MAGTRPPLVCAQMNLLVNIDVPDLARAIAFYRDAFGLRVARRLGPAAVELDGAAVPLYLLEKKAGTRAASATGQTRDYRRHWTPVHLDVVVDDADAAVARAVAAGAILEDPAVSHAWGRIAHLSDPFGHGICILQFLGRGYDALAPAAPACEPVSESDFEALLALRIEAMRPSLEHLGRFDPQRARDRLRSTFRPEHTRYIVSGGERVGFYALRPDGDGLRLDHFYLRPSAQGQGLGSAVLAELLRQADARRLPVRLAALKESASNRFYRRHGFVQTGEGEWDIKYCRPAPPGTR